MRHKHRLWTCIAVGAIVRVLITTTTTTHLVLTPLIFPLQRVQRPTYQEVQQETLDSFEDAVEELATFADVKTEL